MHPPSDPTTGHRERGTILIATVVLVFVVAGMSLVMMDRSHYNIQTYRQQERQIQASFVAESAISMGVATLNNDLLPSNPNFGDLSSSVHTFHSGDSEHSPMIVEKGATKWGHPEKDRMDNDDDGPVDEPDEDNPLVDPSDGDEVKADGSYKGGLYRVWIQEWVEESHGTKDGAIDLNDNWTDDDGDGDHEDNETNEVSGYTNENSRKFTIKAVATYGNYTVVYRAFTNALQTTADKYGVYSEGDLILKSKSIVDSYDSSIGPYGGANQFQEGNIGSEADMTLKSDVTVKGDARYGGTITWDPSKSTVTGDVENLSDDLDNSTWTLVRDLKNPSGNKTVSSGEVYTMDQNWKGIIQKKNSTVNVPAGSTYTIGSDNWNTTSNGTTIEIGSQSNIYFENSWDLGADSSLIINGPSNFSKAPTRIYVRDDFVTNNRTSMTINGRVEMYIVDTFDVGSKTSVDVTSNRTTDLAVSVGGTWESAIGTASSDGSLNLQPKTNWKGFINAPAVTSAVVKPKGDFFGALTAQNIELKSKLNFHYDESISTKCALPGITCAWVADNINSWVVERRGSSLSNP